MRIVGVCVSLAVAALSACGTDGSAGPAAPAKSGSCAPGSELCPCLGGGACSDGLTCGSGICVRLIGAGGATNSGSGGGSVTGGAGGSTGGNSGIGAGGVPMTGGTSSGGADGGVIGEKDACTFACPTGSHWIEGTFSIDYATPSLISDGKFLPLKGETISIVISFDEGAEFKDPPRFNTYTFRVLATETAFAVSGDPSGIVAAHFSTPLSYQDSSVDVDYSTALSFSAGFGPPDPEYGYAVGVQCSAPPLRVGSDQYAILAPFDCASGSVSFTEYGQSQGVVGQRAAVNIATGSGSFRYH